MNACWAFPLVAWNLSFQNCWSPFSTKTNYPIIIGGTYLLLIQNYIIKYHNFFYKNPNTMMLFAIVILSLFIPMILHIKKI
jgi:hypothetical protein